MGFIPTSNNGTNISTVGSSSYSNITKLKSLKDVTLTEPIVTGELLVFDSNDEPWKNTTIALNMDFLLYTVCSN